MGLKALKHWFRIASLPFDTAMSLSDRQNLAESRQFPIFGKPIHSESPQFIWGLPEMEIPQNGWFIMENPTQMDDLGVPPCQETSILTYFNHTWGVFFFSPHMWNFWFSSSTSTHGIFYEVPGEPGGELRTQRQLGSDWSQRWRGRGVWEGQTWERMIIPLFFELEIKQLN